MRVRADPDDMDTRRALLDALAAGPVAGPALADDLGVSRAAVWKAVESLREEGFAVESTPDGYVAPEAPGYSAAGIEFGLDAPYEVEYHDRIGSTNERARELAAAGADGIAVVAGEKAGWACDTALREDVFELCGSYPGEFGGAVETHVAVAIFRDRQFSSQFGSLRKQCPDSVL